MEYLCSDWLLPDPLTTIRFLLVFLTSSATCTLMSALSPSRRRLRPAISSQLKLALGAEGGRAGRPIDSRRSEIGFMPPLSNLSAKAVNDGIEYTLRYVFGFPWSL